MHEIIKRKQLVKNVLALISPLLICGLILVSVNHIQFGSYLEFGYGKADFIQEKAVPSTDRLIGLLFSPGAGLFIYSPVLSIVFFAVFDFYKKDKGDMLIILAYLVSILVFYSSVPSWHGFVSWGDRYLVSVTPFLILLLASSIERRKNKPFNILILSLGAIGAFFSFMWLIQDVSWRVWGLFGENNGLFSLGIAGMHPLNINPVVIWTFEHSQLINAIVLAFTHLEINLYLLSVLGPILAFFILGIITIPSALLLIRMLRNDNVC